MPATDLAGASAPTLRAAILGTHLSVCTTCVVFGLIWHAWRLAVPIGELTYYTSVALLVLFVWSLASWIMLTGSWFDPYSLFLVAASLFNAGQAFLEVFHLNRYGMLPDLFPEETIRDTLFLVFLGLAALHLGALLSVGRASMAPSDGASVVGKIMPGDVCLTGWILLLVSAGPTILVMRAAVERVLTGGYFSLYQAEQDIGVQGIPQILSSLLVPAALFILAGSQGSRTHIAASAAIMLANSTCQLFLGFRYYAIMPLVAYMWVWHMSIRPVPKSLLVGIGVVLIGVVLPLVAATRETRGERRLALDFLLDAYASLESPHVSLIHEMGGSMRTVSHTLELVPEEREYDQGMGYVHGMLTLIPNLFWDIHPSVQAGTPSSWLIWAVDPETAELGGGLGYSFIAEAYLNFGWIGTPLVTLLIGFLYGKFVLWALRSGKASVANIALVACFASFFTFYAREDAHVVFRSLVWYSLGPYCLAYTIAVLRRGLATQPVPEAIR